MTDIKQYANWYAHMDHEGGIESIIRHGYNGGTGDFELDGYLAHIKDLLGRVDHRMRTIERQHGKAIYDFDT